MDLGLFHLMEDFILKEVDYSQEHGYSSRAKRYMRRKLNKELAPYLREQPESHSDSDSEPETQIDYSVNDFKYGSILIPNKSIDVFLGIGYMCIIATLYGSIMYIVSYSETMILSCQNK
jgi:hypothetical protein